MNNLPRILATILIIFIFSSCRKDKPVPPVVTTTPVSEISVSAATSGGNVTSDGGDPVLAKGVCWNTSDSPTVLNNKTTENGGTGAFSSRLTQLDQNRLYYVRAFATNTVGTAYGNQVTFTTNQIVVPVLTTSEVTYITQTAAFSGGNIVNDGGGEVTSRGICWSTSTNPTTADNKSTDGSGIGGYVSNITGLASNTTYYVRAYAINSAGTAYGNQLTFNTCICENRSYVDTSLYISFSADGVYKKYYEMYPTYFSVPERYAIIYGSPTVCRNTYKIYFLGSSDRNQLINLSSHPDLCLSFHKSAPASGMNSVDIPASQIFPPSINVSDAEGSFRADQRDLMDGYSMDLDRGGVEKYFSTDNVFTYYRQLGHPESIATYFNGTVFTISKVEQIFNKCYLIEGSFNTRLLKKSDSPSDFVTTNLTNGKFRIIRKI